MEKSSTRSTCEWPSRHPVMIDYHDTEWGVPVHDDKVLFEFLLLDWFQAGLSWLTILKKRDAFLDAFDRFNIDKVAAYPEQKITELLTNPGIIRNRLKIPAVIHNARLAQETRKEFGSFSAYIWSFSMGKTIHNSWENQLELPATSPLSNAMSKDMGKRGYKFAGSTICYAFMQSIGMVNDHLVSCFRYRDLI